MRKREGREGRRLLEKEENTLSPRRKDAPSTYEKVPKKKRGKDSPKRGKHRVHKDEQEELKQKRKKKQF